MAITSKKVFITSSVFFAFIDRNHPNHSQAAAFFRYFAQEKFRLYVNNFSVIETYNQVRKHVSYSIAKEFIKAIFLGNIEIIRADDAEEKTALRLILNEQNFDLTFEQALINVLADRRQIPCICSFEYTRFFYGITSFALP